MVNEWKTRKASPATAFRNRGASSGHQLGCGRAVLSVLQSEGSQPQAGQLQGHDPHAACPAGPNSAGVTSSWATPPLTKHPVPLSLPMAPAPPDRIFPQSGAGRPSLEAAAGGPGRSQLCADEGPPSPQRLPASFPRLTQARGLSSPRHPSPEVSPVWQHLPLKRWLLPRQVSDESHKSVLEELLPGAFLSLGHVSDPGQDTSTSPAPQSLPRVSNASTAATQHRKPQPSSRNMLSGGGAVSLSQTKEGKLGKVKG